MYVADWRLRLLLLMCCQCDRISAALPTERCRVPSVWRVMCVECVLEAVVKSGECWETHACIAACSAGQLLRLECAAGRPLAGTRTADRCNWPLSLTAANVTLTRERGHAANSATQPNDRHTHIHAHSSSTLPAAAHHRWMSRSSRRSGGKWVAIQLHEARPRTTVQLEQRRCKCDVLCGRVRTEHDCHCQPHTNRAGLRPQHHSAAPLRPHVDDTHRSPRTHCVCDVLVRALT